MPNKKRPTGKKPVAKKTVKPAAKKLPPKKTAPSQKPTSKPRTPAKPTAKKQPAKKVTPKNKKTAKPADTKKEPRRSIKLTDRVKQNIKDRKGNIPARFFSGDALSYLKKYRALKNARKAKKQSVLKIEKVALPKNTQIYKHVERLAKQKGITVAHFVAAYADEIQELIEKGSIPNDREIEYLIEDVQKIASHFKIFVNGEQVSKSEAAFLLENFKFNILNYTNAFKVIVDSWYTFDGNLHFKIPTPEDLEEILEQTDTEDIDKEQGEEDIKDFLDNFFPGIRLISSPPKDSKPLAA